MPTFQINTNFALAGRNGAQKADAQVPHQALRLQNARSAVREARPVRTRQDREKGGGDGEKKRRRTIIVEFQTIQPVFHRIFIRIIADSLLRVTDEAYPVSRKK